MSRRTLRRAPRSKRSRVLLGGGLLLLAVVVLALLALPLLGVPGSSRAAKADLTQALSALRTGDQAAARAAVDRAREHVDDAQDDAQGLGGDVWSAIPWIGTPVADARHLVQALDDVTAVAEIGVDLYPAVTGQRATLFTGQQVDGETLDAVLEGAGEAGDHLSSARTSLSEIRGSTPVIGDTIAANRDAAEEQVLPLAETFDDLEPLLDELPEMLGFEGERSYLIAMLNPSELRFSGGAALSFAPMYWDQGRLELGEPVAPSDDAGLRTPIDWRKVARNNFHRPNTVLANSTLAPSWSVSGEELLRAWRTARGKRHDGLVAIDVVALSKLVGVTGGIDVPGYGTLTADTLTEALVGSYDDYYPDPTAQDSLNDQLIPAFQSQFLSGGDYVAKARALGEAARERHLATYFRDDAAQEAFAGFGTTGDLSEAEGDYLGVFTQNTSVSKADFWQERQTSLDVRLRPDGSATNELEVVVDNASPPYTLPVPDPGTGYFTRWSGLAMGVFLPDGVTIDRAVVRGEPGSTRVRSFYDHDYVRQRMLLEPDTEGRVEMAYDVPQAATEDDDGGLTYRLAVDPQGTVNPGALAVTVRIPRGYRAGDLPEGWRSVGDRITFATPALRTSQDWTIVLEPSN